MTYQTYENSVADGQPFELHDFNYIGDHYCYTTLPFDAEYFGRTFKSVIINSDRHEDSDDTTKLSSQVTLFRDCPLADLFVNEPAERRILYTRWRGHYGAEDLKIIISGEVDTIKFNDNWIPEASIVTRTSKYLFNCNRDVLKRTCNNMLFDNQCRLDSEAYKVQATVSAIDGTTISASAFSAYAEDYFMGGLFSFGNCDRTILSNSGSDIVIDRAINSLAVGSVTYAWPGCDGTGSTCLTKFSNKPNFRGDEDLPTTNPFTTGRLI